MSAPVALDAIDRTIVNALQDGLPVCERPYAAAAAALGLEEAVLLDRLRGLLERGVLSRFGPMYHAERMGGALTLAAMAVPGERFEAVSARVNAFPEVAHNYAREHRLNMWFVVAAERPDRVRAVLREIKAATGLEVYDMPKIEEYGVHLRFEA